MRMALTRTEKYILKLAEKGRLSRVTLKHTSSKFVTLMIPELCPERLQRLRVDHSGFFQPLIDLATDFSNLEDLAIPLSDPKFLDEFLRVWAAGAFPQVRTLELDLRPLGLEPDILADRWRHATSTRKSPIMLRSLGFQGPNTIKFIWDTFHSSRQPLSEISMATFGVPIDRMVFSSTALAEVLADILIQAAATGKIKGANKAWEAFGKAEEDSEFCWKTLMEILGARPLSDRLLPMLSKANDHALVPMTWLRTKIAGLGDELAHFQMWSQLIRNLLILEPALGDSPKFRAEVDICVGVVKECLKRVYNPIREQFLHLLSAFPVATIRCFWRDEEFARLFGTNPATGQLEPAWGYFGRSYQKGLTDLSRVIREGLINPTAKSSTGYDLLGRLMADQFKSDSDDFDAPFMMASALYEYSTKFGSRELFDDYSDRYWNYVTDKRFIAQIADPLKLVPLDIADVNPFLRKQFLDSPKSARRLTRVLLSEFFAKHSVPEDDPEGARAAEDDFVAYVKVVKEFFKIESMELLPTSIMEAMTYIAPQDGRMRIAKVITHASKRERLRQEDNCSVM